MSQLQSTLRGMARGQMAPSNNPLEMVLSFFDRIPSSTYFLAMTGSVLGSLVLYASGKKMEAVFVGLWAPTFMGLGVFHKLLRRVEEESPHSLR